MTLKVLFSIYAGPAVFAGVSNGTMVSSCEIEMNYLVTNMISAILPDVLHATFFFRLDKEIS